MKAMKAFLVFLVIIIAAGIVFYLHKNKTQKLQDNGRLTIDRKNMKMSSPAFQNNGEIPPKYSCDGESVSPPLEIADIPENAKGLALVLHDPDAPGADGFTHWVVFNIDPETKKISENSAPLGSIEGTNSAGGTGHTPPCPPTGIHRYYFKLYALDSELNLDGSATREDVEKSMEGHIIEQAELIGLYQRR